MQQHKFSLFKITLGTLAIVGAFVLYDASRPKSVDAQNTDVAAGTLPVAVDLISPELLTRIVKIESLHIDESFFSNKAFESLQDFSVPLIEEPSGRPNPFAPVQTQSPNPSNSRSRPTAQ